MKKNELILSVRDLNIKFNLRGKILHAIRGIELLTSLMADAVAEGLLERSGKAAKAEGEAEQPMAAWEKELLTEGAPAAEAPAEAEGETKAE